MTASTGKDRLCDVQVPGVSDRFSAVSGVVRIAERRRRLDGTGAAMGDALIERLRHVGFVFEVVETTGIA